MTAVLAAYLLIGAAGCGVPAMGLQGGIRRTRLAADAQTEHDNAVKAGDAGWLARGDRTGVDIAIRSWRRAVQLADSDAATWEKLAQAYYFLADGYLGLDPTARPASIEAFEHGYLAGQPGLPAANQLVEQRLEAHVGPRYVAPLVDATTAGLAYWYALDLAGWAVLHGKRAVKQHEETVVELMTRVRDVAPAYDHGGAYRFFGVYYAATPTSAGGDLGESWSNFALALQTEPHELATYNLIAASFAPRRGDGVLFDQMIQTVLAAPADAAPDLVPEATIEKQKATALQAQRGTFPF